jgi:hypothetical protein
MDQAVVKCVKRAWAVALACVTTFALLGWGFPAAAAAAVVFAGVSLLVFVAFFLYLLMGDVPPAARVLVIVLFLAGVLVEIGAMVAVIEYLAGM